MDWFERLTGFPEQVGSEAAMAANRSHLEVRDGRLHSLVNGASYGIGEFELVALRTLRERLPASPGQAGGLRFSLMTGEARALHQDPAHAGAFIQVASQFNLLEMTGPDRRPEDGVGGYEHDHTQGPACAIACGAGTIWRNYFVPVDGLPGQAAGRQLDALADLGRELAVRCRLPVASLWEMRNGYALCTPRGLAAIAALIQGGTEGERDALRGLLRIGVQRAVEVTDGDTTPRPMVSQAYCSALPVNYGTGLPETWQAFATLVLEAAYEATLLAAAGQAVRGGRQQVLLTLLGGGVFGNAGPWIRHAILRALRRARGLDLDVRLVCYRAASREDQELLQAFEDAA